MKPLLVSVLILAAAALSLAPTADSAQIGLSTGGPRPSPRRDNEPPKPRTVQGRVDDEAGKPITGARVFLKDTKSNLTRTATTDGDGFYEFKNLPPEVTYDLTADFKGATEKKSLSGLLNRTDNVINFRLKVAGGANAPKIDGPVLKTYDGFELRASFDLPTGVQAPISAVLLLHGYGEDRTAFEPLKKQLLARGLAVMALDLRGHGSSTTKAGTTVKALPGWRTSSHEFPQDIEPALDWLKSQPRINTSKIAIVGYDIGASLALIASGRFPEVRTVAAIKPNFPESLAMAGGAQDFHPKSALVVGAATSDSEQWKAAIAKPARFLEAMPTSGSSATFEDARLRDAIIAWLTETF